MKDSADTGIFIDAGMALIFMKYGFCFSVITLLSQFKERKVWVGHI